MKLRRTTAIGVVALTLSTLLVVLATSQSASALPSGFADNIVFSGLDNPVSMRFASDGRVFVLERGGVVKEFDSLSDNNPTTVLDIGYKVKKQWDRGSLGLELDPGFTTGRPYLYLLYSTTALPGWPQQGCANLGNDGDCVTSGQLSRFTVNNNVAGNETQLLTGWCQQFGSHSIGDLRFGNDGGLYVSSGEGASFLDSDTGQFGNLCGDPANEGGSFRAQDYLTTGDPQGLSGSVIKVDTSGNPWPSNPFSGNTDTNKARLVAQGLRNPFRINTRPGTNEIWIGDVGWGSWEEVNRIADPTQITNFGWPCYEGYGQTGGSFPDNALCQNVYNNNRATAPATAYAHPGNSSSSATGVAFYPSGGGSYPGSYNGGLFYADYAQRWIKFAPLSGGQPNFGASTTMVSGQEVVDLETGPNGDLFYVNLVDGTIHRLTYTANNNAPSAAFRVGPTPAPPNTTINVDGTGSTDPDGDQLTYAWDFNDDGNYGDASGPTATTSFGTNGNKTIRLRVTDPSGATSVANADIVVGNAPVPVISTPAVGATTAVGANISFSGSATDPDDGVLDASRLSWKLTLQHCSPNGSDTGCHSHEVGTINGVANGSFVMPDHLYYSFMEITLTATDSAGTKTSVTRRVSYGKVNVYVTSTPSGVPVAVNGSIYTTPFVAPQLLNSVVSIGAPTSTTVTGTRLPFASWSNGGGPDQTIRATQSFELAVNYGSAAPPGAVAPDNVRPIVWFNGPADGSVVSGGFWAGIGGVDDHMQAVLIARNGPKGWQLIGGFMGAGPAPVYIPVTANGKVDVLVAAIDQSGNVGLFRRIWTAKGFRR